MNKLFCVAGSLFALISILNFIPNDIVSTELKLTCNGICETETTNTLSLSSTSDDDLERINSSPMRNYFYNLRGNYGFNSMGTCAYVALGMLFTYYDAYYNDNLVPEEYEVHGNLTTLDAYTTAVSPGSWEIRRYPTATNYNAYVNNMYSEYGDKSLHANLLKLGYDMGYDNGLSMPEVLDLLEEYLADNSSIDDDRWMINYVYNEKYAQKVPGENYTYSEKLLQSVINLVNIDIPVYLALATSDFAHAVIAYDYDENTDTLYAHFGQENTKIHYNVFEEYDYIMGYLTLNPKDLHSHSNNYDLGNSSNRTEICSCSLPNHKHSYTYKSISTTQHIKKCVCGYSTTQSHRFTQRGAGRYISYLICGDCGYMKRDNGEIIPIQPYNAKII